MRKGYEMNKRRNKITIFIVAALMFTSTWAGVFAADPEQPADTAPAVTGQGVDDQNVGGTDPAPADSGQDAEDTAKGGEVSIAAPTATVEGKSITVTWEAVEGATYIVTEKINDTEKDVYTGDKNICTLSNKDAGEYMYKVTVTVDEDTYVSEYSEPVPLILPEAPNAVTGIKGLSGCNSVLIRFDKGDADGFIIYRYKNAGDFNRDCNRDKNINPVNGKDYITYSGTEVTWKNANGVSTTQNYWYRVYAVNKIDQAGGFEDNNVVKSEQAAVVQDKGCVRPMYITLKLKKKRTLKSLNGGPKITLKKNTVITADGFGGGCYYFTYNGKRYRMARTSAKKQVAYYNGRGNWDYSAEEAELFVNQKHLTGKGQYLIWVSFYTQRMYIMKRSGSEWKYYNSWDCATGKAATPSPTGNKAIGKKKKSHHNIKWWSSFSNPKSIANSIHGKKKGWKLGLPQSHGCIRNEVVNAKWVYDNCPKNTMVYNY